jgi:peptide chain release factor subunit 1
VYRLRGGRLEEIVDESDEVEGQHSQGGWSQARYQRHIENVVREHLGAVGGELDKRVRRARGPKLVIFATEELRPEIEGALAQETREAIVGWGTAEAHAGPDQLLELALPYLDQALAAQEEEALERWREAMGTGGRGSAGWQDTLQAATEGRVEELLLADGVEHDDLERTVRETLAKGGTVLSVGGDLLGGEGVGALLRY